MPLLQKSIWYVFFIALLSGLAHVSYTQDQDSTFVKTTELDEIIIYGLKSLEFQKGSQQQHFDSSLKEFPADDIASLIQKGSSVYIKEYGNQMLSTISLRGTGAGHTSTLWNGLNVSSPTLGQFDFSQAPSIITDELMVHYGGASSLFGNESVGGTVIMQSQSQWNDTPSLMLYQDAGSFGSFNTRAVFRTNSDKLESASKAYFSSIENDYPYSNILVPGAPDEYQQNASSQMEGFAQDLYWRPNPGQQLSLHAWYHHSNRQIQPSMANPNSEETQEDRNFRLQSAWKMAGKKGYVNGRLGFIHDYMLYNKAIATVSDQIIVQADAGTDLSPVLKGNIGGSLNHIVVDTDNYLDATSENRWDIYTWLKYEPTRSVSLSANLRYAGATGFDAPVSPSLGSEIVISRTEKTLISWMTQAGFNYRIPTLNDRYWEPGGNPDLEPENSFSTETGLQFDQYNKLSTYEISMTVYSMWIDNWILWMPQGSFWSPQNLREVESKGLELQAKAWYELGKVEAGWSTNYTYTQSTNQTQLDPYDRSKGKQLPYVPFHNLSLGINVRDKHWNSSLTSNYTGERFTSTDNENSLDDFWLIDCRIGRKYKFLQVDILVQNLLNTTYYHLPLRPMPGRNYRVGITFNL
jgi:iron complex outermembrane receptor protein